MGARVLDPLRRERLRFIIATKPLYTEQYRMPLDALAVVELERTGLDAMLYGVNGRMHIRCGADLFRAVQERIGAGS